MVNKLVNQLNENANLFKTLVIDINEQGQVGDLTNLRLRYENFIIRQYLLLDTLEKHMLNNNIETVDFTEIKDDAIDIVRDYLYGSED